MEVRVFACSRDPAGKLQKVRGPIHSTSLTHLERKFKCNCEKRSVISTFQLAGCMRAPWHMSSGSLNSSLGGGVGCYSSVAGNQPVLFGGHMIII